MAKPSSAVIVSGDLHNVGDLLLLVQCALGIRHHAGIERVGVRQWNTLPDEVARQLREANIDFIDGRNLRAARRAAHGSLIVLGGGQLVRDNSSPNSLLALAAMTAYARATGGGCAILGCGVDRLTSPVHRRLWRYIMRRAQRVAVRDLGSQANVRELAPSAEPVVTADLAFLPTPLHQAFRAPSATPASIVVAPCIDAGESRSIDIEETAFIVDRLCHALRIDRVSLLAHDARLDRDACAALQGAIVRRRPACTPAILASLRLEDYIEAYASAAVVLTNRLHAMIFALLAGRPIFAVDDGTAKVREASKRFLVETISPGDGGVDAILKHLASDQSPRRAEALQRAGLAAEQNFTQLLR